MRDFSQQDFEAFLGTLKYPPNPFQEKVLRSIAFGEGNIVVEARAGSGKTSLLVMIASLMSKMGVSGERVMFLAFNVKIADELNNRLPAGFKAINSHKVGNRAIPKKTRLNKYKVRDICKPMVEERFDRNTYTGSQQYNISRKLEDLVSKVMLNLLEPNDTAGIMAVANHHGMFEDEIFDAEVVTQLIQMVPVVMAECDNLFQNASEVSFDEMLYIPVKGGMVPRSFDYVLVDECQDLNKAQQELAFQSLREGGRIVMVGDISQAIYGFAGADANSFQNLVERSGAEVLPLNICYRCPTSHLDLAKSLVPVIEPRPNAPIGTVERIGEEKLADKTTPGSLVMCRLTAPLISAYFDHVKARKKAAVLGRDIGGDLIKMMEKVASQKGFDYRNAITHLDVYVTEQKRKLAQRETNESQIELLMDKRDALETCIREFDCHDMRCLKAEMEELFGTGWNKDEKKKEEDVREAMREEIVTLCTVHRAKGLEAHTTFIIRPDKMPLSWSGQKAWEAEQERNILYVALTRSTDTLYLVGDSDHIQPAGVAPKPEGKPISDPELMRVIADMDAKHDLEGDLLDSYNRPWHEGVGPATPAELEMAMETGRMPVTLEDKGDWLDAQERNIEDNVVEADVVEEPTKPSLGNRVKIYAGRRDNGAAHRGVELARDLIKAGRWDDEGEIWFDDAYAIHTAVYSSVDDTTINDLVIDEFDGDPLVRLPREDEDTELGDEHFEMFLGSLTATTPEPTPQPSSHLRRRPLDCPACEGTGEDGKWACDTCDGEGLIFGDVDLPETKTKTISAHEVSEHLRTLPAGMQPTDRARELAAEHGINLDDHPGKTFVSPHGRDATSYDTMEEPKQTPLKLMEKSDKPTTAEMDTAIFPSTNLSKIAVDTKLKTLDDTRPGATILTKLEAFDVETIDTLIEVLTHLKAIKQSEARSA